MVMAAFGRSVPAVVVRARRVWTCAWLCIGMLACSDLKPRKTDAGTDVDDAAAVVDEDGDDVSDGTDNCPDVRNAGQRDVDGDGVGDACDNCKTLPNNSQSDADADGEGDACEGKLLPDGDADNDGVPNQDDLCVHKADPSNVDSDNDRWGDVCDNCPGTANAK